MRLVVFLFEEIASQLAQSGMEHKFLRFKRFMEEKVVRISVRNLVEFILREGDIDNRISRKYGQHSDAARK